MKLSRPKDVTWWVAVVLGVLGIIGHFITIPFVSANDFWFVAVGFILLALGTYFKGM